MCKLIALNAAFSNSARRGALRFEAPLKNKMISFKVLNKDTDVDKFISEINGLFANEEIKAEMEEMLLSYIEDEDAEFAAAVSFGCLLVRIYDGEYLFLCPIPINESASIVNATDEVRKYAIHEEIPITFIDVHEDDLDSITESFRFAEMHEMDEDGIYMVKPLTELDQMEELPPLSGDKVSLLPICEENIHDYARLCRSEQVNKLFGYDYKEDYEDPDDRLFYDIVESERDGGIGLAMAIIYEGHFAGEASIFAFDYLGGAKVAIRLLPEFWGKGLGSDSLSLVVKLAREMNLEHISTAVKKENLASIAMTKKHMNYKCDDEDAAVFELEL